MAEQLTERQARAAIYSQVCHWTAWARHVAPAILGPYLSAFKRAVIREDRAKRKRVK